MIVGVLSQRPIRKISPLGAPWSKAGSTQKADQPVRGQLEFESCELADAVVVEPVSILKFPANREKNREFYDFRATPRIRGPVSPMNSRLSRQIPYIKEQGNSRKEQGISGIIREFPMRMCACRPKR
jgi:hypothetical protein